jgi:hypothetical protein
MTSAFVAREDGADHLYADTRAVTCVIKTNPGEHFSVMAMIPTMISLDEYEKLTRQGRDLAPGVASPAGLDRKRDRSWQLKPQGSA